MEAPRERATIKPIESKNEEKAVVNTEKQQIAIQPDMAPEEIKELLGDDVTIVDAKGNELGAEDKIGTGAVVKTSDGAEFTVVVPGDTDGDGAIASADARTALRASVGLDSLDDAFAQAADIDANGEMKPDDARTILRISVKLEAVTKDTLTAAAA